MALAVMEPFDWQVVASVGVAVRLIVILAQGLAGGSSPPPLLHEIINIPDRTIKANMPAIFFISLSLEHAEISVYSFTHDIKSQ